jgi:hypothetical protein
VEDAKYLSHRAYCFGCSKLIEGIRWKCGDSSCIKRSWCMSCNDVRGSDGGWCSHDHPIQIPSGKVGVMRALWEWKTRGASSGRREIR